MSRAAVLSGLAGIALASTAFGDEVIFSTTVIDHPDGTLSPPPYGIRLDGLFNQTSDEGGGVAGAPLHGGSFGSDETRTTFSFMNMKLQVIKNDSGDLRIEISGTAFGGVDTGSGYGFGRGLYEVNFVFDQRVTQIDDGDGVFDKFGEGWKAESADGSVDGTALNQGTITKIDDGDLGGSGEIITGSSWDLFQTFDPGRENGDAFKFVRDGHRLGDINKFVGRGWLTFDDKGIKGSSGQVGDFLFTVPLPGSAGLAFAGLGLVALRRRRFA